MVPNGPSLCRICEGNDDKKDSIIKNQTYKKKKPPYKNVMFYW